MTIKETFVESKDKGQVIKLQCVDQCYNLTEHLVMVSLKRDSVKQLVDPNGDSWISWSDDYQIIQCLGCKTISFRHINWHSEAEFPEEGVTGTTEKLYPPRDKIKPKEFGSQWSWDYEWPTTKRLYEEAIKCFNNDCRTLCAAAIRAIIESICVDHNIQGIRVERTPSSNKDGSSKPYYDKTDLEGKITALSKKGILTESQAKILQAHRWLGNDAVHSFITPPVDKLELAIDLVEHILTQLYETPKKGQRFIKSAQKGIDGRIPKKEVRNFFVLEEKRPKKETPRVEP